MLVRLYAVSQRTWEAVLQRECSLAELFPSAEAHVRAWMGLAATGHYWFGGGDEPLHFLRRVDDFSPQPLENKDISPQI